MLLSSCGELRYGIEKTVFEMEQDKEEKEATRKDGLLWYTKVVT